MPLPVPMHFPIALPPLASRAASRQGPRNSTMPMSKIALLRLSVVLLLSDGNRTAAARALGITRATLYKKLKSYDLELLDRV